MIARCLTFRLWPIRPTFLPLWAPTVPFAYLTYAPSDHSTIIYEPQQPVPLVRIVGNPLEENILATLAANTNEIYILDVRVPGVPVATLDGPQGAGQLDCLGACGRRHCWCRYRRLGPQLPPHPGLGRRRLPGAHLGCVRA